MLSEYKFWMIAGKEGVSYPERYTTLTKAYEVARLMTSTEREPFYVLEAVWVCRPVYSMQEQPITEREPKSE